ncbi:MAG TPA: polysaccharide deacetylase family protein [Vicingus sp.]|nr:polysaccharide deacetylase family protein [Vicingus sp.]
MYLVKTPKVLKRTYPKYVWDFTSIEKTIYLTFDDGPTPEITSWVLDELKKYNAKATFFCIGKNVEQHPDLFNHILAQEHAVGNHTYNHLNGWETKSFPYLKDVVKCSKVFQSTLFRPPYGKLTRFQAKAILSDYTIIMWDVLSADFDKNCSPEKCLKNVLQNAKKGSIVVFHDSLKAEKNLKYTLPKVLEHFTKLGFQFKAITN